MTSLQLLLIGWIVVVPAAIVAVVAFYSRRGPLVRARRPAAGQRASIQAEPAAVDRLPLRAEEAAVSRLEAPSPGVGTETSGGATP